MTAVIVWVKMLGRFVPNTRQELSGPESAPIAIATQDTRVSVATRLAALSARIHSTGVYHRDDDG